MVNLWVRILMSPGTTKTFSDVPKKLQPQVKAKLEENGCTITDDGTIIMR